MRCKYDRNLLFRVVFTKRFMYNVMLLGRLYEKDVFGQVSQTFEETQNLLRVLGLCFSCKCTCMCVYIYIYCI